MRARICAGEDQGSSAKAKSCSKDNQCSIRSSKEQLCSSMHGTGAQDNTAGACADDAPSLKRMPSGGAYCPE